MNWKQFGENVDRASAFTERFGDDLQRLQTDEPGFRLLSEVLKTRCGIDLPLSPKNLSLMASRMRKLLLQHGFQSYREYANFLNSGGEAAEREFISALTTNTTHFFREHEHFDQLRTHLPALIENKRRAGLPSELRVWCAASSTGQEPYSILLSLLESGAIPAGWDLKFLSTDIDHTVLAKAAQGVYRGDETENVPPFMITKYFDSETTKDGAKWRRMKPKFSNMIRFAPLNLLDKPWPFEKSFDIIFCRNVLIYFDSPTAVHTVERLANQLAPGGLLFVGHSECGHVRTRIVKTMAAAAYQRIASTTSP